MSPSVHVNCMHITQLGVKMQRIQSKSGVRANSTWTLMSVLLVIVPFDFLLCLVELL